MSGTTTTKELIKRVDLYGPKPRSAAQALTQARDFFQEEGHWVSGHFFQDGDPREAYEQSMCSSWSACAMGGLGLVTGEMPISVKREGPHEEDLDAALREFWIDAIQGGYDGSFQDYKDHEVDDAIEQSCGVEYYFEGEDPVFNEHDTPMSYKAAQFLAWVIADEHATNDPYVVSEEDHQGVIQAHLEEPVDTVITNNDHNTRTEVLRWFDAAIEKAKRGKLPTF